MKEGKGVCRGEVGGEGEKEAAVVVVLRDELSLQEGNKREAGEEKSPLCLRRHFIIPRLVQPLGIFQMTKTSPPPREILAATLP